VPHTPFSNLSIGDECCFLCGTSNTITQEHVFPKWLQQRYNLWNQTIELLNGSTINYRRLKIPCCSTCNNEDLSRLESMIASGVTTGYEACLGIGERSFYLWVGKLFFGILRKEIQLAANRARPDDGPILPADVLERFSNLHRFLQGITSPPSIFRQSALLSSYNQFTRSRPSEFLLLSKVLRLHVSDWLTNNGDGITWYSPPNLVPTWITDEQDQLLLQPLAKWQTETCPSAIEGPIAHGIPP
jgi:hypothetical protein